MPKLNLTFLNLFDIVYYRMKNQRYIGKHNVVLHKGESPK